MRELCRKLNATLTGRVCVVGVGNTDRGDDGLGVRLVHLLGNMTGPHVSNERFKIGRHDVVVAHTAPERYLQHLAEGGFDQVLFLDAVESGGQPGTIVFLDSAQMQTHRTQVSTHEIALGLLAQLIEANGHTRVWLLGMEPATTQPGGGLTSEVETGVQTLARILAEVLIRRPE